MLRQLERLTEKESDLVKNAPALVTILIAGADNEIEDKELLRAVRLAQTKSFDEHTDLRDFYAEISFDFEEQLNGVLAQLPENRQERETIITELLSELNKIWKYLDYPFARRYYESLKSFAHQVARASGGVLTFNSISPQESRFIGLPMIEAPKPPQEGHNA